MSTDRPVAVVGGGAWGSALAHVLASRGHTVRIWVRSPGLAHAIRETRENARYLPGVPLVGVEATAELTGALDGAGLVVCAVPSHVVRAVFREAAPHVEPGAIAALLTRRFGTMLATATAIAVGATLCGIYLSFFLDSAPAPTIVVLMTVLFVCAFLWQTLRSHAAAPETSEPAARR